MKKNILSCHFICLLILVFTSVSLTQSDYETVQKFKKDCEKIENQIKNAITANEINLISVNIEELRSKYSRHSELLDKALYPEKYQEMMENLSGLMALRESEFNKVEEFNVAVNDLKQRVDTLNVRNNELQASLNEIKLLFDKSRRETANLKNSISELKVALHKRDMLVMDMVDSLMPPVMREKPLLSSEDEEKIMSDIEKDNILVNVKLTITDNIKYLDLTSLQPEDLTEIREQQIDFAETWARIGPRLTEVYSEDGDRARELFEIDSLFTSWTVAIENEAWQSIKEEFVAKGISLEDFSDAKGFVSSVNQYIESEKNIVDVAEEDEAKQSFEEFAEHAWESEIEPKWAPFLIENGMLAETDKEVIEENIDVWRSELYPSKWWLWIIIAGILFSGLALLLRLLKRGSQIYDQLGK